MNILSSLVGGLMGAGTGLLEGGPVGAIAGGVNGLVNGGNGPSGLPNISPSTDPTLPIQQGMNLTYELQNLGLEGLEMQHQVAMQEQSQQFNDVEDEKTEQMRETNTLREVAMKQRDADDKIVKEFIKTAGGE